MGATTKLNIGKIPVSKGEYQEGTTYQRLNQVTMLGSTYQSKIDGNTSAPAQMGAEGAVENINTDKWLCIAVGNVSAARKVVYNNETSGLEAGNVQEAIDEVGSKVSDLSAGTLFLSLNEDGYVNTGGTFVDSIHFKNSGYIPLALIDNIKGSLTESIIAYTISYYDENLTFLGGNNLSDKTLVNITSLSAPEGSKYVLICQGLSVISNYNIRVTLNKSVATLNDFFDFKKEVSNKISSFTLFRLGYNVSANKIYNPRKDNNLFCLNSNIAGNINSISVKTIPNKTYNIYKANRKTKNIKLLAEVEGGEDGGWKTVDISETISTEEVIGYIGKTDSDFIPIRQENNNIGAAVVVLNKVDYNLDTFTKESISNSILLPLFITGVFNYSNDTMQNVLNTSETLKCLVSTLESNLTEVESNLTEVESNVSVLCEELECPRSIGQDKVLGSNSAYGTVENIWGLNIPAVGKISSLDILINGNADLDIFKVNKTTLTASKIGSVSNESTSPQIKTVVFENPIDITFSEFIGVLCIETKDKFRLGNASTEGFFNTIVLNSYNRDTNKGKSLVIGKTYNIGILLHGNFNITGENIKLLDDEVKKLEKRIEAQETTTGSFSKPLLGNFGGYGFLGNIDKALITDFDFAHIIQYGQSLSDGTEISTKITSNISDNVYCISFDVNRPEVSSELTKMKDAKGVENPIIGTMDSFARMYAKYISSKQLFIGTSHGAGGYSIEKLSKHTRDYADSSSTTYESRFIKGVENTKEACNKIDKTVGCVAIIFYQGESNYGITSKEVYKERLVNLKNDMQADIMNIYGQSQKPLFFIYGGCGARWISDKEVTINMAILEAAQENDDIILMGPVYQYPEYWRSHLSVNGNRMHGEKTGEHLWNTLVCNNIYKPLQPIDYRLDKELGVIEIDFSVPYPPLVFDTNLVQEIPNYGFKVFADGIQQTVTSVNIIRDTVVIKLQTPITATTVEVNYAGHDDNLIEYCGTGNLRDSSVWKSMYSYWDDSEDLGTYLYSSAGWEKVSNPEDADTYNLYQNNTNYSIGDKVKMKRNGIEVYVKATKNGLLEPPYHQVVHRPKDVKGIEFNELVKKGASPKYPMYNWCINFYHKFEL